MSRDDELAETAAADAFAQTAAPTSPSEADPLGRTATNVPTRPSTPTEPVDKVRRSTRDQLGRLRIEGVIGRGGMGSVYAAYDPDLERRVAVKLLHADDADARARLLREARAMAKLDHPNVITVFDVGSTDGEDFVTMELVDGETLKDWLARERPTWRTIVEAFIEAGRGLAAAHHEGLIHRDFKPANVLRSKRGKIVVTDFGLSRAASETSEPTDPSTAHAANAEDARAVVDSGPTTRTQTGAVLGTPAYMAPEQWTGSNVGPASDQFAFSVALAEALVGTRPFSGDSFDALRKAVFAGPGPLDGVPRQVRAIVRRGLAVDPSARWPSMSDMLDRLERALHRRRKNLRRALAICVGLAGVVTIFLARHDAPGGDGCVVDVPLAVWSPGRADALARLDASAAKLLGERVDAWRKVRVDACHEPAVKPAKLACLDGALARIDLAARDVEKAPAQTTEGTASILVDPATCLRDTPPRLANPIPADLATALGELRTVRDGGSVGEAPLVASPCARALQLRTRLISIDTDGLDVAGLASMMQSVKEAFELAERCTDDDWVRATVLVGVIRGIGIARPHAELAVATSGDPMLAAELDLLGTDSLDVDRLDDARALLEHAIATYGPSRPRGQLRAVGTLVEHLLARGRTSDLKEVLELVSTWRSRGIADDAGVLDSYAARARWRLGEVAAADELFRGLGHFQMRAAARFAAVPTFDLTGVVVDPHGAPVAGAEVSASPVLDSDSHDAASPTTEDVVIRRTRTAADGSFALAKARGLVVAASGDRRSEFAAIHGVPVRLVVGPTSRVTGSVKLNGLDPARVRVMMELDRKDAQYDSIAPVRPDGSFELDHVLRGPAHVFASEYAVPFGTDVHIDTTGGAVANVVVEAHAARPLWIIARNTGVMPADLALVFVFTGHIADAHPSLQTLHRNPVTEVQAIVAAPDVVPPAVRGKLQSDDLFVSLAARPSGPLSVCSTGVAREYFTKLKTSAALREAFTTAEMACADVTDDDVVVVEVPPMRKLKLP